MCTSNLYQINQLVDYLLIRYQDFNQIFLNQYDEFSQYNLRRLKNNQYEKVLSWYEYVLGPYQKELFNYDSNSKIVKSINESYKIFGRVKSNSLDKLMVFLNNPAHLIVSKTLNDIYGCRIILSNIRDNEQLIFDELKASNKFYRIIQRYDDLNNNRDSNYHAIHCYIQLNNYEIPWEIQIWDSLDEFINLSGHLGHEKRRGY